MPPTTDPSRRTGGKSDRDRVTSPPQFGPEPRRGGKNGRDRVNSPPQFDRGGEATDRSRLGIRALRGRLTSLVRQAGAGERIVITIAGRPVAQLGPVEPATATVTIDDLVARGLVEPARRGDRPIEPDVRVDNWTGRRLDHALREVRGS